MTIKISIQDTKTLPRKNIFSWEKHKYSKYSGKNCPHLFACSTSDAAQLGQCQCSLSSGAWENKVVLEEVRRYSQDILILRFALSKSQPQPH